MFFPLDAVASPTSWQSAPSTVDLPLIPPLLHGCDYSQNTYHMNPFMMPIPPVHQQQQQGCVEHKSDLDLPAEQMHYGGRSYTCSHTAQLQPHPELNLHPNSVSGKSNVQAKKEHCAQQCMHNTTKSGYAQRVNDQWRPPVIVKAEKQQQSVNSDPKNKDITEETKNSRDCKEKNIQSEGKKVSKTKVDRSSPEKGSHVQTASLRYVLHCLAVIINLVVLSSNLRITVILRFEDNTCYGRNH